MEDGLVRNTLAFRFPPEAPPPSLVEVARFVKNLDADLDSMETGYKMPEEKCVCVKFKSLDAMKEAQAQIPEICVFRYSNGEKVEVKMTVAGCCTRYVRIFDIPPEVPDSEISAVLGRYGVVKRLVREKFPADLGLNMFTGVRGAYVDIKKAIPATLYFLNRKGRLFYEGLKQKCFFCKEEGHLKADCPKRAGVKNAVSGKGMQDNSTAVSQNVEAITLPENGGDEISQRSIQSRASNQPSYSGVLSGIKPNKVSETIVPQMVTLVSERNKSSVQGSSKVQGQSTELMEAEDGVGKSAAKRQHSTGGSSADTDEEATSGFTKVMANRRTTRSAKKVMTPLEAISNGSLESGGRRSASK